MGIIGGTCGYYILRRYFPRRSDGGARESSYGGRSKLETLLGPDIIPAVAGKTALDFGCGTGAEAIELARQGAARVIGIDIRDNVLAQATDAANAAGMGDRCVFTTQTDEKADVILSLDAFEHFSDPAAVLETMNELLAPNGTVWISFGPTWYHPFGGHLFSVFPWAHLVFTEAALLRWRSDFNDDGATRFHEVAGGLNQMTIRRFCRVVKESPFEFSKFKAVPIGIASRLHNRLTQEVFTSVVRCTLRKKR